MQFDDYDIPPPKLWTKFQQMVCDLAKEVWKDPHAQEFGRPGQKQDGIDIIGRREGKKIFEAVQATKRLTEQKIKNDYEASTKLGFELDCIIFATTDKRDAEKQTWTIKLSQEGPHRCVVWFWEDIIEKLSEHKDVRRKYYPSIIFIESLGDSAGRLVEVHDKTTRWVLLITKLDSHHKHYGDVLLISDLLSCTCQTYRLGGHWSRLVLDDWVKADTQRCVGGNKYGAFLVSHWLNSFKTVEDLFRAEGKRFSFEWTTEIENRFHQIIEDLREENDE